MAFFISFSAIAMDFFYAPDEVKKCKGCHRDVSGMGGSIFSFPQIRAQDEDYLYDQLLNFKYGYKKSRIMQKIARKYEDDELRQLSKYFSNKKNKSIKAKKSVSTKIGKKIYEDGIDDRIIACTKCHSSGRERQSMRVPKLRYHHPMYIKRKLKDYRKLDITNVGIAQEVLMHLVVKDMSDEEIESVSYYINERETEK